MNEAWIWDVKPSTYETLDTPLNNDAQRQLNRYLQQYRLQNPATVTQPGFGVEPERDIFIPGVLSESIHSGTGRNEGFIFYKVNGPHVKIPDLEISPEDAARALLVAFLAYAALHNKDKVSGGATCFVRVGCVGTR